MIDLPLEKYDARTVQSNCKYSDEPERKIDSNYILSARVLSTKYRTCRTARTHFLAKEPLRKKRMKKDLIDNNKRTSNDAISVPHVRHQINVLYVSDVQSKAMATTSLKSLL